MGIHIRFVVQPPVWLRSNINKSWAYHCKNTVLYFIEQSYAFDGLCSIYQPLENLSLGVELVNSQSLSCIRVCGKNSHEIPLYKQFKLKSEWFCDDSDIKNSTGCSIATTWTLALCVMYYVVKMIAFCSPTRPGVFTKQDTLHQRMFLFRFICR